MLSINSEALQFFIYMEASRMDSTSVTDRKKETPGAVVHPPNITASGRTWAEEALSQTRQRVDELAEELRNMRGHVDADPDSLCGDRAEVVRLWEGLGILQNQISEMKQTLDRILTDWKSRAPMNDPCGGLYSW